MGETCLHHLTAVSRTDCNGPLIFLKLLYSLFNECYMIYILITLL